MRNTTGTKEGQQRDKTGQTGTKKCYNRDKKRTRKGLKRTKNRQTGATNKQKRDKKGTIRTIIKERYIMYKRWTKYR